MKTSIHVEFTDEELKKHAADVGRRWVQTAIHEVINHVPAFAPVLSMLVDKLAAVGMEAMRERAQKPAAPKIDAEFAEERGEPLRKCERNEEDEIMKESWVCCKCHRANSVARPVCQGCDHRRCDVQYGSPTTPPSNVGNA